jgi:ubiquitin carboxyl-terminal hydrolase 14
VRFFWKQTEQQKSKILRAVTFPQQLDMYEFATDALKAALDPARSDKIQRKEEEDAVALAGRNLALGGAATPEVAAASAIAGEASASGTGTGTSTAGGDAEMSEADAAPAVTAAPAAVAPFGSGSTAAPGTRPTGFYDLVSVLTHKGRSADSGHYVSWVKQEDDTWTEFDDHQPNPKNTDQILALKGGGDHHMGYLLMYKAQYI